MAVRAVQSLYLKIAPSFLPEQSENLPWTLQQHIPPCCLLGASPPLAFAPSQIPSCAPIPIAVSSWGLRKSSSVIVAPLLSLGYLSAIFSLSTAPGTTFFNRCVYMHLLELPKCPDKPLESKAWSRPRGGEQRERITWAAVGMAREGLQEHAWHGRVGSGPRPRHPRRHRPRHAALQQHGPQTPPGTTEEFPFLARKESVKLVNILKIKHLMRPILQPGAGCQLGAGSAPCPARPGRWIPARVWGCGDRAGPGHGHQLNGLGTPAGSGEDMN